jgi:hypothetical protein
MEEIEDMDIDDPPFHGICEKLTELYHVGEDKKTENFTNLAGNF